MIAAESVRRGRVLAERLMIDVCDIDRVTLGALNTSTGTVSSSSTRIVTGSPCRVRPPTAEEVTSIFGDRQITQRRYVITLPASTDTSAVRVDDIVTVTGDRSYRVVSVPSMSFVMYVPLGVEVVE